MRTKLGRPALTWGPHLWSVMPNGCHEWKGTRYKTRDKDGNVKPREQQYGKFGRNGYAHRHALALKLGRPIGDGLMALHTCDNPSCVLPDHLYEGTASDNMRDMADRGRMNQPAYYEKSSHCKKCGEEWTEENTLINIRGVRNCKNCNRVKSREQAALRKQAHEALGLTQKEYTARYGHSKATALAIIEKLVNKDTDR
jgi:hypothetical protein